MPESPVKKQQFSVAPPGKKAMTAEEMQAAVSGTMQAAAQILGGKVVDGPAAKPVAEAAPDAYPINDEDKKKYIRSLLSKEPFTKSYELFGGKLRIALRTRKTQEADTIVQSGLSAREKHKERLKFSLLGMELGDEGSRRTTVLDDLDDVASSAVYKVFNEFEELCDELFRRANDPDFWTRTAGRT